MKLGKNATNLKVVLVWLQNSKTPGSLYNYFCTSSAGEGDPGDCKSRSRRHVSSDSKTEERSYYHHPRYDSRVDLGTSVNSVNPDVKSLRQRYYQHKPPSSFDLTQDKQSTNFGIYLHFSIKCSFYIWVDYPGKEFLSNKYTQQYPQIPPSLSKPVDPL